MRKITAFITVFIFLFNSALFSSEIDNDIDQSILDANKSGKTVLLFIHEDGCPFCEKMVFEFEESDISKIVKNRFLLVDINKDDDEKVKYKGKTGSNFAFVKKKLKIDFFPVFFFIDGSGKTIYSFAGYRNKNKFKEILKYISSGSYKKGSFEEYENGM